MDKQSNGGLIVLIAATLALLIGLPIGLILLVAVGGEQTQADNCATPATGAAALAANADVPAVDGFTREQVLAAASIMQAGVQANVGERGQLIALITAMQESDLGADNAATGAGNDAGVFQQRTLPGWYGTVEQVNDPAYGARMFYEGKTVDVSHPDAAGPVGYHIPGLKDIPGWESMAPGDAAQEVQRSAFPRAYDKHIGNAQKLMQALSGKHVQPITSSTTSDACAPGEYMSATTMDALPHYPIPEGCTDSTPFFGEKGPGGINGNLPDSALCALPNGQGRLQTRAVAAFIAMNAAFRTEFGHDITITDSYRSYAEQVATKASKPDLAATPGYSNHGFGLALDLSMSTPEQRWVQQHGPSFGWWHPTWARPGGSMPENWHYEYGTWLIDEKYSTTDRNLIAY